MRSNPSDPRGETIRAAVARAQRGDREAFAELYRQYLTPIYRFVFLRVKSREEAEDLTQSVFMKAWAAIREYRERGNPFSAWLYAIARNAVVDRWKKKKEVRLGAEEQDDLFARIPDDAPNPTERAESRERQERIRTAIQHLSEDQQELVILKFIDDLSNHEISAITGKSEDAIRQLQFRALKALRNILSDK